MKWELVVTDPSAGKTGRVRIEAPDQATAERIVSEKGWVISSVRPFEASPAPAPAAPVEPPPRAENFAEASVADAEAAPPPPPGFPEATPNEASTEEPAEEQPRPVVMPLEKERTSRATGATLPYPPSAAAAPRREVAPASTPAPAVAEPTARRGGLSFLMAFLFWVGGIALVVGGAVQLAYYFGFNPRSGFNENGDPAAAAANRLAEIKALMRALVGGVYIVGGLLAATLGTMLARPPRR